MSSFPTDTEAVQALNLASGGSPNPSAKELATSASGTLRWKSDIYDAPRRSLRQKGMEPEGRGFPYYSPSKVSTPTRLGKRRRSHDDTSDSEDDRGSYSGATGERIVAGKAGTTSPASSRSNNAEDTYMDAQDELDGCEQSRGLTNSNVRRQIIRPWEDDKGEASTSGKAECPTDKQNGNVSPPNVRTRRNSGVHTAAEALVAMATPTKEGSCERDEGVMDGNLKSVARSDRKSEMCNGPTGHSPKNQRVIVDGKGLAEVYERIVRGTEGCSVEVMERIHNTYQQLVFRHRMNWQRENLLEVS